MRYSIFSAVLLCFNVAYADVFTCQMPSGETVYSDTPCVKGAKIEKISPSESVSDPVVAQKELERQKAYTERQAAENARGRAPAMPAILPDYVRPEHTPAATPPLSPASTGQSDTPPNTR